MSVPPASQQLPSQTSQTNETKLFMFNECGRHRQRWAVVEYDKIDAETIEIEQVMQIRPIRTEADYKTTLKEVSRLMESDPDLDTPEGDRLDVLVTLVQAYEARNYPIALPDHKTSDL